MRLFVNYNSKEVSLMTNTYDAIIIGAGIIGCPIAFELAKKGYKTLNIDKLAAAGSGSTSSSGAIVRAHYSTYDGVALAYENFSYWHNWKDYLQAKDPTGMARFMNTGTILIKSPAVDWRNVLRLYQQVGLAYEDWDAATLEEKMPIYATRAYYPPARRRQPFLARRRPPRSGRRSVYRRIRLRQRSAIGGAQRTDCRRSQRRGIFVQQTGNGCSAGRGARVGRYAVRRAEN